MTSIEEIAQLLMRDNYLDNEADARLAAIQIILVSEQRVTDDNDQGGSVITRGR